MNAYCDRAVSAFKCLRSYSLLSIKNEFPMIRCEKALIGLCIEIHFV